jgi:hypothetical protein
MVSREFEQSVENVVRPEGLPQVPDLVATIDENHLRVVPVKDGEKVIGYDINSRGGRQLFRVSPGDMTFALVKNTILETAADNEEVAGTFDIIERVQNSLRRLGMPAEDVPVTPHEIAEQAITLMQDFKRLQEAKSEIDLQNNLQAFLGMSQRAFVGGKSEFNKLAPAQQRLVMVFGDTLLVRALEQLGVGEGTIATSEAIKQIAENLAGMRRESAWYTGFGKALKGLGHGTNQLLLGNDGLVDGLIENTDKVAAKGIERTAEIVGRTKKGLGISGKSKS